MPSIDREYPDLSVYDTPGIDPGSTLQADGTYKFNNTPEIKGKTQVSRDPYLTNRKYAVIISKHNAIDDKHNLMTITGSVPKEFQISHGSSWASPWGGGLMGKGFAGDLMAVMKGNRLLTQSLSLQVWQGAADDTSFSVAFELIAYDDVELDVMVPLRHLMELVVPRLNEAGFLLSPGATIKASALAGLGAGLGTLVAEGTAAIATGAFNTAKDAYALTKTKFNPEDSPDAHSRRMMDGKATTVAGLVNKNAEATYDKLTGAIANSKLGLKSAIEQHMENLIQIDIGDWFTLNNCVITNVEHRLSSQMPGQSGGVLHASVSITFRPMFALTSDDLGNLLRGVSTA